MQRYRRNAHWPGLAVSLLVLCARADESVVTMDSCARAVAAAKPGQTVLLADGVYRDVELRLGATGTPEQPVTLRARTPGRVIFTGKSLVTISGTNLVVSGLVFDQVWNQETVVFDGAKHARLTDCAFTECGNPRSTFSKIVHLRHASQHCRVDHCFMRGNLSMGMGVRLAADDAESTHATFDHNYFKDIARRFSNGQEPIQIGQGSFGVERAMHALVEYCLFDHANGDAELISNKASANIYRFNTFTGCDGALTLRGGGSVLVQGNVFLKCKGAIRSHAVHSFIVGNFADGCNDGILLNAGSGGEFDAKGYTTPHHGVIANNVIQNCRQSAFSIGRPALSTCTNAPFANLFLNNALRGTSGELIHIAAEENSAWKDNTLLAEGQAGPGAKVDGTGGEAVDWVAVASRHALPPARADQIRTHEAELKARLAAMPFPLSFEVVFPSSLEVKLLTPAEVGPTWMHGDPQAVPRIPDPQPVPKFEPKKK